MHKRMHTPISHSIMTPCLILVVVGLLLVITFIFGLVVNNLYLWVLGFRMNKSINSTWFFHFIVSNLVFTLILPFILVFFLMYPHWIFGLFLCKVINALISVAMYTSVFVLMVISLDRYLLVFHPHWYRSHMKSRYATIICLILWALSILCSSPYLVFRNLRQENGTTLCFNDYSMSRTWESQRREQQIKWAIFSFRILVGYLFPFFVIAFCYLKIALKMRKEKLAKSSKPYKIIFIAILSFFVSWMPYHAWYAMGVEKGRFQESTLNAMMILTLCLTCFNSCFTPIFYLFIVESFKKMFKKSILSLVESMFSEAFVSLHKSLEEKSMPQSSSMVRDENHGDNT
ncbi:putative G-protein coupled receptor 33 [Pelodytes ibericus]